METDPLRAQVRGRLIDYPYSEKPVGRITYDRAGRMSVQLMRPGRRSTVAPGVNLIAGNANGEEIREAIGGFIAYFCTFDVDENSHTRSEPYPVPLL